MTEKNNKETTPYNCSGCKYEKSTSIKKIIAFCTNCKRAYFYEDDSEDYEDRYEAEESEE